MKEKFRKVENVEISSYHQGISTGVETSSRVPWYHLLVPLID